MLKKLITFLYDRYVRTEKDGLFEMKKTEFSENDKKQMYIESDLMLKHGFLEKIVDIVVAESEFKQLYGCENRPVTVTDAQLEAARRGGIEDLMQKIKALARRVPSEGEKFDMTEPL